MTRAELLDRMVDEVLAGRSPDAPALDAELGVATRMVFAVAAVPASAGRADIRRHVLTAALQARPRPRLRRWFVLVPSTVLLLGGGIAVASSKALPGDPLYSIRRGLSAVRLVVAVGESAKARALLNRATASLGDAERLATGPDTRLRQALRVFAGDVADARAEAALLAAGERADLEALINNLVARAGMIESSLKQRDESRGPSGDVGSPDERPGGGRSDDSGKGSGRGPSRRDDNPGRGFSEENPADSRSGPSAKQSSRGGRRGDD